MGATTSRELVVEKLAFRPPPSSYDDSHPHLLRIKTPRRDISIMRFSGNSSSSTPTKRAILYAHGNACDIGHCASLLTQLAQTLKTDFIAFDYDGYGLSMSLPIAQKTTAQNASNGLYSVFEWMRREGQYATENIFL